MSWDYNFFSPEDNVYNSQSPNDNIRYIVLLLQSNGGIDILMMISLQRLINYAQTNF
jgi:hypothetical protein